MVQRVGVLRVTVDGGAIGARAEGQLSLQEWVLALEMTKSKLLASAAKESVLDMIPRKIDRREGEN